MAKYSEMNNNNDLISNVTFLKNRVSDAMLYSLFVFTLILLLFVSCDSKRGKLPPSVKVLSGDVNGVVINRNDKKLVLYGNPKETIIEVDNLLLTHCRRDLLWIAKPIIESGAITYVPAEELEYFSKTDSF